MTEYPDNTPSKQNSINVKQFVWRGLSILITGVLLILLIQNIEPDKFVDLIGRISIISLLGAFLSYFMLNIFRAIRFRVLLDKGDTPLRLLIPITLYHNFLVRLLPFKLGEISYIMLLRSRLNYSMEEGVSSLFAARILELLIIVMVFATGILLSGEQFAAQRDGLMIVVIIVFIGSVFGLYFAGTLIRVTLNVFDRLWGKVTSRKITIIETIKSKLLQIAVEFDRIRHPQLFISALSISGFTYTTSFLTNYILLRAVGLDVEVPLAITIISIGMFASAFPFSVSGFGVVELSWVFGLTQFAGYADTEATSIGFLLHGFQVVAASLFGLVGYLLIQITPPLDNQSVTSLDAIQQQELSS
jgi:glycosyltransferase 2 family protein